MKRIIVWKGHEMSAIDIRPLWAHITADEYADLCEKHLKTCTKTTETFTTEGLMEFVKDVCCLVADRHQSCFPGAREAALAFVIEDEGMMSNVGTLLRHGRRLADAVLGDRDAYEGAREDLLDWKRRALRAEAGLRDRTHEANAAWKYLEDDCAVPNDGQAFSSAIEQAVAVAEEVAYRRGKNAGFNEANGGATFMGEPATQGNDN
jgi:hypothetical protein